MVTAIQTMTYYKWKPLRRKGETGAQTSHDLLFTKQSKTNPTSERRWTQLASKHNATCPASRGTREKPQADNSLHRRRLDTCRSPTSRAPNLKRSPLRRRPSRFVGTSYTGASRAVRFALRIPRQVRLAVAPGAEGGARCDSGRSASEVRADRGAVEA